MNAQERAAAELRRLHAECEALRNQKPRRFTQNTVMRKLDQGIHSQGWQVIGRGGSWSKALKPLMDYLNGAAMAKEKDK